MENKGLSDNAKIAQREYMKRWRSNNKEKEKEYRRRYWEKKAKGCMDK